uniref:NADH-ubiquinone oxidoreductase chain 6 n=1 Tax=Takobia yixiani TaxID=743459 RepID=X1W3F8_9INSE|nr:NADH dehydrogenase subunit 6 [Takobia yixiani]
MMQVMLVLLVCVSLFFMFLSHPVSMGLTLIMHALLVGVTAGLLSGSLWFSYILFLVFLGGVLVLYIYMTSLASNEKFSTNFTLAGGGLVLMISCMLGVVVATPHLGGVEFLHGTSDFNSSDFGSWVTMSKLYDVNSFVLTTFLVVYLLFVLLVCAEVAGTHRGALRGFN